jgi:hydrogenase expression/formation protein HypC
MCLGIPGQLVEVDGFDGRAEFWDVEKSVRLDIVGDEVEEGDYILNHAGFAIRKIPDDQVEETIEIYEAFLEGDEDEALDEIGAENERLGIERIGETDGEAPGPVSNVPGPQGTAPGPQGTDPTPAPEEDEHGD